VIRAPNASEMRSGGQKKVCGEGITTHPRFRRCQNSCQQGWRTTNFFLLL
jgi:hypothetical protein